MHFFPDIPYETVGCIMVQRCINGLQSNQAWDSFVCWTDNSGYHM